MTIECPHCGQLIALDDNAPSAFECPTCNGRIELQVERVMPEPRTAPTPIAKETTPSHRGRRSSRKSGPAINRKVTLPNLLIGLGATVMFTLLAGWLIWGDESTTGSTHEQSAQVELSTPEEAAVESALKTYWSATSVEERLSVVRRQADTGQRMRAHYENFAFKPKGVELVKIHDRMKDFNKYKTWAWFDSGATLPEGFVFVNYRTGSSEDLASGKGDDRWSVFELKRDFANNTYTAKMDWESYIGWAQITFKALKAQKKTDPAVVRCLAQISNHGAISSGERNNGWSSIRLESAEKFEWVHCAIHPKFHAREKLINILMDGEEHHLMLKISHRGGDAGADAFILNEVIKDSWFIADEAELFARFSEQK